MVVSNPTLLVLSAHFPHEFELYIYLLNTERSSSGVRINDLAKNGLECAIFHKYWFVTTRERSFPVRLDREILKVMRCIASTRSPPQDL